MIDGGLCEECHEHLGYIVHHRIALTPDNINDATVTLNHSNLEYVCKYCHDRFENHFINQKETLCRFDSNGMPIAPHN